MRFSEGEIVFQTRSKATNVAEINKNNCIRRNVKSPWPSIEGQSALGTFVATFPDVDSEAWCGEAIIVSICALR